VTLPLIFISHAHRDLDYVNRLLVHLAPLSMRGSISSWDDTKIEARADWKDELERALGAATVAIFVVSPDYLASDFIYNVEVPSLLKRRESGELLVVPLIVRASVWSQVPWLRKFQAWPSDGRPLATLSRPEQDVVLASLVREVAAMLHLAEEREEPEPVQTQATLSAPDFGEFFISHDRSDGDFAELLSLRLDKEGLSAWIDTERLTVGLDWRQEIDQSIRNSRAVVVLVTPAARQSEYVTYEWAFALGVGVPVVPILLAESHLYPRLEALQYFDFTNRGSRPWAKLFGHLRSLRGERASNDRPNYAMQQQRKKA
jgi:TIR domain-containing protein